MLSGLKNHNLDEWNTLYQQAFLIKIIGGETNITAWKHFELLYTSYLPMAKLIVVDKHKTHRI